MKRFVLISVAPTFIAFLLVWYVCAFHVIDIDVWWHIAAGRIMRSTGWLIQVEPFAYTRVGEPYLATQSWLAQIILSSVYDLFGSHGLIILRSMCITLALAPAFFMQKKYRWLIAPLVVFAAASLRPVILDRPQLFSYVMFAACMYLAFLWLEERITTKKYLVSAVALQIFWVNLHGGAALLHLILMAGVLLQTWNTPKFILSAKLLGALIVALFISPNFLHTFGYVQNLFTDNTVDFIQEWQPRKPWNYLRWILPWWILSLLAVCFGKRFVLFSVLWLLVFGFFSLQAIRHEPFFILSALFIIALQLTSDTWRAVRGRITQSVWVPACISFVALLSVGYLAYEDKYIATGRLGVSGYGAHEPVRGAYEFLEAQNITGNIFHNYDAGAHLNFLGYPERKTFVDGRNVDFGFAFLEQLFAAEYDQRVFRQLQAQYQFTHAVIYYGAYQDVTDIPYVVYLQNFADWSLVYIDDYSAVYALRSAYPNLSAYKHVQPQMLVAPSTVSSNTALQHSALQQELQRAIKTQPSSMRLPLVLAASHIATGRADAAETLIASIIERAPHDFAAYNLLAVLRVRQERYAEAGSLFEQAIAAGGGAKGTIMNYEDLAWVFEMAGNLTRAEYYKKRAQR